MASDLRRDNLWKALQSRSKANLKNASGGDYVVLLLNNQDFFQAYQKHLAYDVNLLSETEEDTETQDERHEDLELNTKQNDNVSAVLNTNGDGRIPSEVVANPSNAKIEGTGRATVSHDALRVDPLDPNPNSNPNPSPNPNLNITADDESKNVESDSSKVSGKIKRKKNKSKRSKKNRKGKSKRASGSDDDKDDSSDSDNSDASDQDRKSEEVKKRRRSAGKRKSGRRNRTKKKNESESEIEEVEAVSDGEDEDRIVQYVSSCPSAKLEKKLKRTSKQGGNLDLALEVINQYVDKDIASLMDVALSNIRNKLHGKEVLVAQFCKKDGMNSVWKVVDNHKDDPYVTGAAMGVFANIADVEASQQGHIPRHLEVDIERILDLAESARKKCPKSLLESTILALANACSRVKNCRDWRTRSIFLVEQLLDLEQKLKNSDSSETTQAIKGCAILVSKLEEGRPLRNRVKAQVKLIEDKSIREEYLSFLF